MFLLLFARYFDNDSRLLMREKLKRPWSGYLLFFKDALFNQGFSILIGAFLLLKKRS